MVGRCLARVGWRPGWQALFILVWALCGCAQFVEVRQGEALDRLVDRLEVYLESPDSETEPLLQALSQEPVGRLISGLAIVSGRSLPDDPPRGFLPGQVIEVEGAEKRYGLYVPDDYNPLKSYPLIICLHGAGFDGDAYLGRWQPRLSGRYLLACPTVPAGAWWTQEAETLAMAVLRDVSRRYHVDRNRVFLTGMSNGGVGTFLIGLNYVDRFAALVPMAAAFPHPLFPLLENARQVPFYLIHGEQDQVMPVQYARDVVQYLKLNGQVVVYREHRTVHPMAGGHFFPKDELAPLVRWLEDQHRNASPREIRLVRDRDHPGRAYWIRIDEIDAATGSFWASEYSREESQRLQDGMFARIQAAISGNTVTVTSERVLRYTLLLNSELVDPDRPVRVVHNDRTVFEGRLKPDPRLLLEEFRRRPDPDQLVEFAIPVTDSGASHEQ